MSVTSTMTESLRMVRNQESFLLLFFKKDAFPFAFLLHEAKESERIFFEKKKQKNFYWLGELSTENSIANGSALGTGRPFSRGGR